MKRGSAAKLRPCLEQGASLGEETVLTDSGWVGEITAWVGRVRSLTFLSSLPRPSPLIIPINCGLFTVVFPQTRLRSSQHASGYSAKENKLIFSGVSRASRTECRGVTDRHPDTHMA